MENVRKIKTPDDVRDSLRELVDSRPEGVRKQVDAAFSEPPAAADEVDAWFVKHFHGAPISHDTELFNQLHAAKDRVRAALTPAAS